MEGIESRGVIKQTLSLVLVAVLIVAVVMTTIFLRERQRMSDMVERLGSTSASERSQAIEYLYSGSSSEYGRIGKSAWGIEKLEAESENFSDAALSQMFDEIIRPHDGDWSTMFIQTPRTYLRSIAAAMRLDPLDTLRRLDALAKLDMMLQFGNRPDGSGLVWDHAEDEEKALIREALLEFTNAAAADPDANFDSCGVSTGLSLIGSEAHEMIEPLFEAKSSDLRREAWLTIAVLKDPRGRDAEWEQEEPKVAEAILVARVLAAPDTDRELAALRERLAGQPEYLDVLDALSTLPRNDEGGIDISRKPTRDDAASALRAELYGRYALVSYFRSRLHHFRHRDDTVYASN
ncbi:MAG: hypothetical protein ACF8MJ_05860 [Phycisphaerales bacterium JB050]